MKYSHLPSHKAGPFEFLVYFVSVINPLMALPQIWKIWILKGASDVSFLTWSSGALFSAIWLIYALKKKDTPIMITNLLGLVLHSVVALQILYYGPYSIL